MARRCEEPRRDNGPVDRIGIADTMFARFDMAAEALDELASCPGFGSRFTVVRRTVPGMKDLGVAAKRLIELEGCCIVLAFGMPGAAPIDQVCAHEASQGIMLAQLLTNTHVLEVFVHETEADDPEALAAICRDRARKHARNAYWMLYEPAELKRRAGKGIRQGHPDAGPLVVETSPARGG
jgi:riboflavin synthase